MYSSKAVEAPAPGAVQAALHGPYGRGQQVAGQGASRSATERRVHGRFRMDPTLGARPRWPPGTGADGGGLASLRSCDVVSGAGSLLALARPSITTAPVPPRPPTPGRDHPRRPLPTRPASSAPVGARAAPGTGATAQARRRGRWPGRP